MLECTLPVRAQEGEKTSSAGHWCHGLKATWLERQKLPSLFQVSRASRAFEVTAAKILLETSLQLSFAVVLTAKTGGSACERKVDL